MNVGWGSGGERVAVGGWRAGENFSTVRKMPIWAQTSDPRTPTSSFDAGEKAKIMFPSRQRQSTEARLRPM